MDVRGLRERLVDTGSPLGTSWFGERWSPRARVGLVAAVFGAYALAFGPLYDALGLGVTALSFAPTLLAAGLLGQRGGLAATLVTVVLHTLLLNAVGGQDGTGGIGVLVQRGRGTEALALLLAAGAVGWLRDLGRRMLEQGATLAREHRRRGALLRVARRLAAETDPRAVLTALLEETGEALEVQGTAVFAWNGERTRLVPVKSTLAALEGSDVAPTGPSPIGQAVERRRPVVVDDGPTAVATVPELAAAGAQAVAAVPLVHEGDVVGALAVWTTRAGGRFAPEDVQLLELLAATAATTLVSLERARLDGVRLAGRTAEHEMCNRLVAAVGWAELLAEDPQLPPELRPHAEQVLQGARAAVEVVRRLTELTRIEEIQWPGDSPSTIDLERSTAVA